VQKIPLSPTPKKPLFPKGLPKSPSFFIALLSPEVQNYRIISSPLEGLPKEVSMKIKLFAVLISMLFASPVFAGELAGVSMPDSVSVGGKNLVLNGMGLRKKSIIKVYVAGLYLPTKMKGSKAIIGADTERRMVMQFVRNVGADKICGAWKSGLTDNTANVTEELKKQFDTLCSYMADMSDGGKMTYTYVPGTGTTVDINGSAKGTIPGKAFADALFRCWIGSNPPGENFKAGLTAG